MIEIPLTQGKFAIIDDDDFDRVNKHKWHVVKINQYFYAKSKIKIEGQVKQVFMHRFILNTYGSKIVDHDNHNTLDNRKVNISECDHILNGQNRLIASNNKSGVTGVVWHKKHSRWFARITVNKKVIHLGYHNTLCSAKKARQEAELKYFHKFK